VPKELARDCESHSIDHGVQDDGYRVGARGSRKGARGGVNQAPAYYVGGPWNGAAMKAGRCCGGRDEGAPMDGPGHMLMVPVQGL
jgi:hypothetical protein